jgi:hypothetical protein
MKVKIVDTNSAHTQKFIGKTGELILNYPFIAIKTDDEGKYINTSKVQTIIIQTNNTKYMLEVI